jgi:hypothetical protein
MERMMYLSVLAMTSVLPVEGGEPEAGAPEPKCPDRLLTYLLIMQPGFFGSCSPNALIAESSVFGRLLSDTERGALYSRYGITTGIEDSRST